MLSHKELKRQALADAEVRAEYDRLAPEFMLLEEMLRARKAAGLTQEEIALRMGTKAPAVTRLENSLGSQKHSPSLATLRKYADAVGCDLQVRLLPRA